MQEYRLGYYSLSLFIFSSRLYRMYESIVK